MDDSGPNLKKRRILLAASGVLGGVATVAAAVPFFMSMLPSARARAAAAPVEVDLSKIEPGMLMRTEWRGMPVWVLHRTPEMLASLPKTDSVVADPQSKYPQQPEYCRNEDRSIQPEWFVVVAICTHLGCVPLAELSVGDIGPDWQGGFFCPCHGSKYDLAGRVFKDVPAPLNLVVPRYQFLSDTRLLIGADKQSG